METYNDTPTSSYINTTESTSVSYFWAYSVANWIWRLGPPLIITFGSFGNIMIIIILCRQGVNVTNVFLTALAIVDISFLYCGLFTFWLAAVFNIRFFNMHVLPCKCYEFLASSLSSISSWLVVLMTIQRAVSVIWPHLVNAVYTERKTIMLVLGSMAIILALHSHFIYGYDLVYRSNRTYQECSFKDAVYYRFLWKIWSWVDLAAFTVAPFCCIVLSNGVLVWKLKMSVRNAKTTNVQASHSVSRSKSTSSITRTIVAVSLTYIVLVSPVSICTIILSYLMTDDLEFRAIFQLGTYVAGILWYSHNAVNFYIYCLTGTKFRSEFKVLFCGGKRTETKDK